MHCHTHNRPQFGQVVTIILLIFSAILTAYLGIRHGWGGFWAGIATGSFLLFTLPSMIHGNFIVSLGAMGIWFVGFLGFNVSLYLWECHKHPEVDPEVISKTGIAHTMLTIIGDWCESITAWECFIGFISVMLIVRGFQVAFRR